MIYRTKDGNVMVVNPWDGARRLYDRESADTLMRQMGCDPATCDVDACRDAASGEHLPNMLLAKVKPMRVWKAKG
jgi:hypothetical protein